MLRSGIVTADYVSVHNTSVILNCVCSSQCLLTVVGLCTACMTLILTTTPVSGLFSRTTWVSQYQKGKTSLDLNETRDGGVLGWQWHQLDHMQTICTSLQTDNHINTSSLNFFEGQILFVMSNQQCQSTEGI